MFKKCKMIKKLLAFDRLLQHVDLVFKNLNNHTFFLNLKNNFYSFLSPLVKVYSKIISHSSVPVAPEA